MPSKSTSARYFGIKNELGDLVGVFREVSFEYQRPDHAKGRWISDGALARYRTGAGGVQDEVVAIAEEEALMFAAKVFKWTWADGRADHSAPPSPDDERRAGRSE